MDCCNGTHYVAWIVDDIHMITVVPFGMDYRDGFIIKGHADFEEHGKDIVCASVSAISQAVEIGIERYSRVNVHKKSGYLATGILEPCELTYALMYSFVKAIELIAEQHPKHVQIMEAENIG